MDYYFCGDVKHLFFFFWTFPLTNNKRVESPKGKHKFWWGEPEGKEICHREAIPRTRLRCGSAKKTSLKNCSAVAAEHTKLKLLGQWEDKSTRKMKQTELFQRMDEVQARHDDILVERRRRLAELLLREKEEHDRMLANLTESDDQRRERLMQKARDLRNPARKSFERKRPRRGRISYFVSPVSLCAKRSRASRSSTWRRSGSSNSRSAKGSKRKRRKKPSSSRNSGWKSNGDRPSARNPTSRRLTRRAEQTKEDLALQVKLNEQRKREAVEQLRKEHAELQAKTQREIEAEAAAEIEMREARKKLAAEVKIRNEEIRQAKSEEERRLF